MMMTTDTTAPRVWLGCLACYNAGRLVGEWMSPEDAASWDASSSGTSLDRVHIAAHDRMRAAQEGHEEVWVMDHENTGLSGEFGPNVCQTIADAYETVGESQWPAFLAYCSTGMGWADGDGYTDTSSFEEAYSGEWRSFTEFTWDLAEDIGLLDDMPEHLRPYFDHDAWARDLAHDYTTADAPRWGVYVFRNL